MATSSNTIATPPILTPSWKAFALLLAATLLLAIALARIAVWLQVAGFATVMIFPAVCGAALGFGASFIARQIGTTDRWPIILVAMIGAVVMAAAEHGFFYLEYRHQFDAKLNSNPQVQLLATMSPDPPTPATFPEFMTAEAPTKWPLWTIDALTMITIAAIAAWWLTLGKAISD